jgi:hypothetical protein
MPLIPKIPKTSSVVLDFAETLCEVTVDDYAFKITWSPVHRDACILWLRDTRLQGPFEALGQFSQFDRRNVLFFIARYTTSEDLRAEIDNRRFVRRIEGLPQKFFRQIEQMSARNREQAYRHLFSLDEQIDPKRLAARRRIMARKFHPDAGGSHEDMVLINEAYEFLAEVAAR